MIPNMPKEHKKLILSHITLTILKNKFSRQLESSPNERDEKLLFAISDDLRLVKQKMHQNQIKVFDPKAGILDNINYTFTWKNIEDSIEFSREALKIHCKEKLAEYL